MLPVNFHMVSKFEVVKQTDSIHIISVLQHAVSSGGALGPYRIVDTALMPRPGKFDSGAIHGGSIHYDASTNTWLLFHTGFHLAETATHPNCTANTSNLPAMNSPSRVIGLAHSKSLAGPWIRYDEPILRARPKGKGFWDDSDVSNAGE